MTVNIESGTPVERLARAMGAEPVPEMGRAVERDKFADERDKNGDPEDGGSQNGGRDNAAERRSKQAGAEERRSASAPAEDATASEDEAPVKPGEARRTLKARREHSKGDGNFPRVEPGPELLDERPEDRQPRDLPKARDDRSAPKGNLTIGQEDRNPDVAGPDDFQAPSPRPFAVAPRRTVESRGRGPKPERRTATEAKRKPKVALGAKRTRAGSTPTGTKKNVAKRPSSARVKATRKTTRPAVRSKRTRNATSVTPRRGATAMRRRSRGAKGPG